MSQEERHRMLTVAEAADELNVSPRCIRKWLHQGRLQGTLVGRQWLVDMDREAADELSTAEDDKVDVNPAETDRCRTPEHPGIKTHHPRLPPVPRPGTESESGEENRFHAQSLGVWEAASPLLQPLLCELDSDTPLRRELSRRCLLVFEELCRGYHAFHYRDKVGHYHAARDALCSVAAIAALGGNDELSRSVQDEPLPALAALIRSMERKGKKRDGA